MTKRPPLTVSPTPPTAEDFPMPDSVKRLAALAPHGEAVVGLPEEPAPKPAQAQPEPPAQSEEGADEPLQEMVGFDALRAMIPRKEPVKLMSVKMPLSLYERMNLISRITDATMTDMIVAGATKEVAKLEAKLQAGMKKAGG